MSEKVTLSELLAEYGDEKLRFQILSDVLDGPQRTRAKDGTTRLSFRTEVPLGDVINYRTEAFIVWMDKADMKAAMERCKARRSASGPETP